MYIYEVSFSNQKLWCRDWWNTLTTSLHGYGRLVSTCYLVFAAVSMLRVRDSINIIGK